MLTILKGSSLAYQCIFYRPENNTKSGDAQGTEFWKSWKAKMKYTNGENSRVDEKNGVICLVIMFAPGVMVIKMSKMAHFWYFLSMSAKNQSQFGENICLHLKDLIELF